jgi:proteasome lid subunit RPN8/RPN11
LTRRNSGTTNETAICLDKNGKEVYRFNGKNSQARYDSEKLESLPNGSVILVHNHPHGGTFSSDDILTLSNYPAIKTIIAAGHNGIVYSLSINNGKRVDFSFINEYNELYSEYRNYEEVVESLAKIYNWEYKKL